MDEIDSDQLVVDRHARTAAADLRLIVARQAVPARLATRPRGVFGPVAIVVGVLLVVAALAAVPRLRSEPGRPSEAPVGLRWVVRDLPPGWRLITTSGPTDIEQPSPSAKVYFATQAAPAGPIVELWASAPPPADHAEARNVKDVVVEGVDLQIADGPYGQRWAYNVELETMVIAVSLDPAALEEIAVGLQLSAGGAPVADARTLPAGIVEVGAVTAANNGLAVDLRTTSVAISSFGPAQDEDVTSSRAMYLAVSRTSPLTAAVFGLSASRLRTSNDATLGVMFEGGVSDDLRSMMWTYKGLTFWIFATGISAEELERAAHSAVEASSAEWSAVAVDDEARTANEDAAVPLGTAPASTASTASTEMTTIDVEPPPSSTTNSANEGAFCAELEQLGGDKTETYVGSVEHVSDVQALSIDAPPEVADDVQTYIDFLESGFISSADPQSQEVSNWPVAVQDAVSAILTFQTTRC